MTILFVGLAQKFQNDRGRSDMIEILRGRLFLFFVPLSQEADDFGLRQGFIEQLDRCGSANRQRQNVPGKITNPRSGRIESSSGMRGMA